MRKNLKLVVVALMLLTAGLLGIWLMSDTDNSTSTTQDPTEVTPEQLDSNIVVEDIGTTAVNDILATDAPVEEVYDLLVDAGIKKNYVGKFDEALEYFAAAAGLSGIDQELIYEANISAYVAAEKAGRPDLAGRYKEALGESFDINVPIVNGQPVVPSESEEFTE